MKIPILKVINKKYIYIVMVLFFSSPEHVGIGIGRRRTR